MKSISSNEYVIRIAEHAQAFTTRDTGKRLFQLIQQELKALDVATTLVIDFEGVDLLTPSFVDECIGRLVSDCGLIMFKQRVRLKVDNKDWQSLINGVVRNRLHLDKAG